MHLKNNYPFSHNLSFLKRHRKALEGWLHIPKFANQLSKMISCDFYMNHHKRIRQNSKSQLQLSWKYINLIAAAKSYSNLPPAICLLWSFSLSCITISPTAKYLPTQQDPKQWKESREQKLRELSGVTKYLIPCSLKFHKNVAFGDQELEAV